MPTAPVPAIEARHERRSVPAPPLSTKLIVPTPASGFVPRQRLIDGLTQGLNRGLVLVAAPAGSGKTSMLAHWAQGLEQPVAWLSVDEADNDPARFWGHLVSAVGRAVPGAPGLTGWRLGTISPTTEAAAVAALINGIDTAAADVVLVVDDYDRIDDPSIHGAMAVLMDRRPEGLRLVLACRGEPALPIARLRATGRLFELGTAELRMRHHEVDAVICGAGLNLPSDIVRLLWTRTEGWAAGVRLACLSLQGQERQAEQAAAFDGRNRYVLDFLVEEVLARQSPEIRRFLRQTSILDRISGGLADALTGRNDGQELLEQIERANLFLIPLDDRREWWRYHRLFAELMRGRLLALEPQDVSRLHGAAAAWLVDHGLIDDAIRHFVEADDRSAAAIGIERDRGWQAGRIPIPGTLESLSGREREVLELVAAGHANREIADELFITVDTVKRHVTHILGKLGAQNRTAAAAEARRLGLLH